VTRTVFDAALIARLDRANLGRCSGVCVPSRRGISYTDIARARRMHDHGASAFEREEGETRALSFRTVQGLPASSFDPMPIVRAPSISRGAATTSDVVRGPYVEDAGRRLRGERGFKRPSSRIQMKSTVP